jgi:DNA-binding MarR family transcriptional regulator
MALAKKNRAGWVAPTKLKELAEFRYRLRRFLSFSEMASEALGISAQQYQVLQVIATVPEGRAASISYLAERMMVRHNSAVELVDRTEKVGLVRRVADESDHRRSLVEITARGGELLTQLAEQHLIELETAGPEMARALRRLTETGSGGGRVAAAKVQMLGEERR